MLLLALWPNFASFAALLQKEGVLVVLWPAVVLAYLRARDHLGAPRLLYAGLPGILLGIAVLVQPARSPTGRRTIS